MLSEEILKALKEVYDIDIPEEVVTEINNNEPKVLPNIKTQKEKSWICFERNSQTFDRDFTRYFRVDRHIF